MVGLRNAMHPDNSCATPTPVTDGRRVYAYFGAAGVLCTDRQGRVQWVNTQLPFHTRWGVGTSPSACDDKVIILSESDAGRYLAALDTRTGREVWRTERHQRIHNYTGNCRTPTVENIRGQRTIVVWGYEDISGYDPATGRERWSYPVGDFGHFNNPVCTAVSDATGIYLVGPEGSMKLAKDKLGSGQSPIVWRQPMKNGAQCSSPVLCQGLLFAMADSGHLYCLDPLSGATLWETNLARQHYASLIAIGSHVYATDTYGRTTIFDAGRAFHPLARNDLRQRTVASPAPVNGRLYIRTKTQLFCVAEP